MPEAKLLHITPDAVGLIKKACSMPYGKDISDKALAAIIDSGHRSVLEHATATFHVKCSVAVLGQITRHRHLSFTCKSARGSKFTEFYDPLDKVVYPNSGTLCEYEWYLENGEAEQDARYWLPQGVMTEFVVTGNLRAWMEYLPWRICQRAMPEHRDLAMQIWDILKTECPQVFDRDIRRCKNCPERSCKFK